MRFNIWFYLCKAAVPLFLVVLLGMLFEVRCDWLSTVKLMAIAIIMVLGAVGAVMGIMLAFGKLRMQCPFCGRPGNVGGSKQEGLWMECDQCGFIHGAGFMRMRIKAEIMDAEQASAGDVATRSAPEK